MDKYEIGQAITNERIKQGISIRQLAKLSGRDTRAVQAVINGKYSYGIDTLIDVARAVGLAITTSEII